MPEGERKLVTALFVDIINSTGLEQNLDPEEARAIIDPVLQLMIDLYVATTATSFNPPATVSLPCLGRRLPMRIIRSARSTPRCGFRKTSDAWANA